MHQQSEPGMWRNTGLWGRIGRGRVRYVTSNILVCLWLQTPCYLHPVSWLHKNKSPKNNKPHMHFSGTTRSNKPKWFSSVQTVGGACLRRRVSWAARMQRRASSPGRSASTSKATATCAERPSSVLTGWSLLPTVCRMMAGQGNNVTFSHWPLEVLGFWVVPQHECVLCNFNVNNVVWILEVDALLLSIKLVIF